MVYHKNATVISYNLVHLSKIYGKCSKTTRGICLTLISVVQITIVYCLVTCKVDNALILDALDRNILSWILL